jgi:hypothetical protein
MERQGARGLALEEVILTSGEEGEKIWKEE